MSIPFNTHQGLIIVQARLWGPKGDTYAQFALDTGATITTVSADVLVSIGYDPVAAPGRVQMTTASGVEYAPRLLIDKIESLDQERTTFPVIAHTLPPSATVDGLLGLDFFRGQELVIDFRNGQITPR